MAALRSPVFWVVFNCFWTFTRMEDVVVTCQFEENCILPCSYSPGSEPVIHWLLGQSRTKVHAYYHQQDQLALQDSLFQGRTLLFKDQITRGNASLLLTGIQLQDQGRYNCYTSTIIGHQNSYINLKVEAPVRKADIKRVEDTVTCSSEDIYPEPKLVWSTDPPSNINLMSPTTTTLLTEQQLYNISSSLMLSDGDADKIFTCMVSSEENKKKATLFQQSSISSGTEITIDCTSSNIIYTNVTWRFNNSQLILTHRSSESSYSPSKEWEKHVKDLSKTGSLTLTDLSSNQEGIYTCELSDAESTYIKTYSLQMAPNVGQIVGITIGVIIAVVIFGVVCWYKKSKKSGII